MTVPLLKFLQSLSLLLLSPFSVRCVVFWTIFHDFFEKLRSIRWHQIRFYWRLWSSPDLFFRKLFRNHLEYRFFGSNQNILTIKIASKRCEYSIFHHKVVKFQPLWCSIALLFANYWLLRVFRDSSIFGLPTLITFINSKCTYKRMVNQSIKYIHRNSKNRNANKWKRISGQPKWIFCFDLWI